MRVAVVGAGIMGCATARALAGDGHDVVLYEQFRVGHDRGSSHGQSRIVRLAYPDQQWVRLAAESFDGWRELEDECGTPLLRLCGLLEFAEDETKGSRGALAAAGAEFEELTGAQAARWPVRPPDGWSVLYQPQAGIVRADLALRAFLDGALRRGAVLREQSRVSLRVDGAFARLERVDGPSTQGEAAGVDDADVVVVTAGSWAPRLVPDLPVRTTRETVAYFRRDGEPLPSVVQRNPELPEQAMYSLWDPVHGLKAGAHHAGRELDPDSTAGPDPATVERIAHWVAATHPDADPRPVATQTCLYTTTADEGFILRRRGRVVIGSACSGHGFKFAPAVARRLADLAAEVS